MFESALWKPALLALLLSLSAPAQGTWVERAPAHSPSPRSGAGMAYDAERQKVVLFGGADPAADISNTSLYGSNETWEWDGTDWSQVTILNPPPRRAFQGMVYDAARKRIVMFGGIHKVDDQFGSPQDAALGDTWEYDGNTWTQIQIPGPPELFFHSMAYDPDRQVTVLFGGANFYLASPFIFNQQAFDHTWEYDGSTWTQRSPATVPDPPRRAAGLAYDRARRVMVLQGGQGVNGQIQDTWEYDSIDWIRRDPQPQMPDYTNFAMTYDETRGRVMLFGGGHDSRGNDNEATWEYDGNGWTQMDLPLVPPGRTSPSMAYDVGRKRLVVFGGLATEPPGGPLNTPALNDTWEFSAACGVGQANSDLARLEVNFWGQGSCQGPFEVPLKAGGTVSFEWEGSPTMPFALLIGPRKPDAIPLSCYGIPNIGTPPLYGDVQPTLPFFIIGLDGTARQTFSVPPLPPGTSVNLQGVVAQPPGASCDVLLTSAFYLVW